MSFFDGPEQLVVAHRGLAVDYPENTLPAFRAAVDAGADILETDIHASRDLIAVVSHDPSLRRLTGRAERIIQLPLSRLQTIDLGGATMPTLAELLEEFPDQRFSVDIKHPAALEPFVDTVTRMNAQKRVMVASFSALTRRRALAALGAVVNCATSRQVIPSYLASRAGLTGLTRASLGSVSAVLIPPTRYGIDLFHPAYLERLHAHGVVSGAWTINDPQQMRELWSRGVRAIVTDRTDLAVAERARLDDRPDD